jgi:hypothetical protein
LLTTAIVMAISAPQAQRDGFALVCRHDAAETPADRDNRQQALKVALAINAAEGLLLQKTRIYHRLRDLPQLPQLPPRFELRFYSDDIGYVFSIKDTTDPCRYAVFSDQAGFLYEKSAHIAPTVAGS